MSATSRLSFLRQVTLVVGLGARRFLNRWSAAFRPRRKPAVPSAKRAPRRATPSKRPAGLLLLLFVMPLWVFLSYAIGVKLVDEAVAIDQERLAVPPGVLTLLLHEEDRLGTSASEEERALLSDHQRAELRTRIAARLAQDARVPGNKTDASREAQADAIVTHYLAHGAKGFQSRDLYYTAFVEASRPDWPTAGEARARSEAALAFVIMLLFGAVLFASLGTGNIDLGKTEWSLEWLFTMPISGASLFSAKLVEYTIIQPTAWIFGGPLFLALYHSRGLGGEAWVLALCATLCLCAAAGGLRLVVESLARMRARRPQTLQALCSLLGIGSLTLLIWFGTAGWPSWADHVAPLRIWSALPAGMLVRLADGSFGALALALAAFTCLVVLCVTFCAWLVRDGLRMASGSLLGERGPAPGAARRAGTTPGASPLPAPMSTRAAAAAARPHSPLRAASQKDLRLLLRDKNFLTQVLIVPIVIVGMQLLFNRGMLDAIGSDFRYGATLSFAVGAYMLVFSATGVLALESGALWILYSVPARLDRILFGKSLVWAAIASVYTALVLVACALYGEPPGAGAVPLVVAVLVGVALHALIAASLGVLATDPLEQEHHRRVRPLTIYLFMMVASTYGTALAGRELWPKVVLFVLAALLAFALWQRVRDRVPYFLDPTEAPPPELGMVEGVVAAMVFFALQGLIFGTLASATSLPLGAQLLISYAVGGALTSTGCLLLLARAGRERAMLAWSKPRRPAWGQSLGIGAAGGLLAGAVVIGYLELLARVDVLRAWHTDQQADWTSRFSGSDLVTFVLLAVVAAPLFEEYLFRGLLYRGMRRSFSALTSMALTASVFAIVHPAISAPSVFLLGLVTAWCYERTGRLAVPMLVHALYNSVAVLWPLFRAS